MKRLKQISAFIGAITLALLYAATILCACMQSAAWEGLFRASVYATFVIPCLIYAMQLLYRVLKGRGSK